MLLFLFVQKEQKTIEEKLETLRVLKNSLQNADCAHDVPVTIFLWGRSYNIFLGQKLKRQENSYTAVVGTRIMLTYHFDFTTFGAENNFTTFGAENKNHASLV